MGFTNSARIPTLCYVFFGTLFFLSNSEGAISFKHKPSDTLYFMKGSDAFFNWTYEVGNRATDFKFVLWSVYNATDGQQKILFYEDAKGDILPGYNIPPSYVGRVEKQGQATLVVKNITFGDAGKFRCTLDAKDPIPDDLDDVDLVVTGPCVIHPQVNFAELGGSVTFTCNAANVPGEFFRWRKGIGGSEEIRNDSRHSSVSVTGSSQLTIKNINVDDQGYYVCDVDKINPPCSDRGYLQVLRAVKQEDTDCPRRDYNVALGEQLTICCPVSGYPPPIVTWKKNGIQLQRGENTDFTITAVQAEHFGNYTCTATDGKTTFGPFNIIVVSKVAKLSVTPTDGSDVKPAILTWEAPPKGADYYTVQYYGSDVLDDIASVDNLVGKQESLEFHYQSLVMKEAENKPEATEICAEVTAFKDKAVVGVTPTCQKLTIKKSSDSAI